MRIWAKTNLDHKILDEVVHEFSHARPSDIMGWTVVIDKLCQELDSDRPVILQKHIRDLNTFGRTVFRKTDFIYTVEFDNLEIECFPENKEKLTTR